jgi:hypothetical protein
LLTLSVWESDPDDPTVLPAPLADGRALEALNRVQGPITATQTRTDRDGAELPATAGPARLLGPAGPSGRRKPWGYVCSEPGSAGTSTAS